MFEIWILFGFIGVISLTAYNIYQKYLVDIGFEPITIVVMMNVISFIPFIYIIYTNPFISSSKLFYILLITTSFCSSVSFLALIYGFKSGAISLVAPLRGITPIVVAFIEPFLFGGFTHELTLIISSIFVASGIYIILYENNILSPVYNLSQTPVRLGLLSGIIIAGSVIIDRYILVTFDINPLTLAGYIIFLNAIFLIVLYKIFINEKPLRKIITFNKELAVMSGIRFSEVSMALITISLVEGTRVSIFWQLNVLLSAIIGGKLIKEDNLLRKGIGATLILIATIIVII